MSQHTLRSPLVFEGPGLHTGEPGRVRVLPGDAGTGLRFRLANGRVEFEARAERVVDTRRATVIGSDGVSVSTVEHLLSALFALGVDNAIVEVDGPEIPVLDGSSATFSKAITQAGLVAQDRPRPKFEIDRAMVFSDGDATLVVSPADNFRVRFAVDFAAPVGAQFIDSAIEPESYVRDISAARTFGYLHEVEALRAAGLALGGTLENALVFDASGPMTPLLWPNEVVRHKVLDLVGDFALLGAWPKIDVVSIKSGHRLHAQAARALRAAFASGGSEA